MMKPYFSEPRGSTYVPSLDRDRLGRQQQIVFDCMVDGVWRTLREIEDATGQPQASVSARLREFDRLPGYRKERRRRPSAPPTKGVWEYRVVPV